MTFGATARSVHWPSADTSHVSPNRMFGLAAK
jgi:hypothetical protein